MSVEDMRRQNGIEKCRHAVAPFGILDIDAIAKGPAIVLTGEQEIELVGRNDLA
jgi:hypothetical protein